MNEERVGLSLTQIARRIQSQEVSATHALEDVLEHVAHADDTINAFVTVLRDQALQEATAADHMLRAGHLLGPLHGVPVAIKDILTTDGITTTAGSKILADWKPDFDATVVRKLRQAGAVIIGKTNLHEFAFGVTTENPHHGNTRNPWNPDHVPGGSSGGSGAAAAMGMRSIGIR
ncbi:MAG: amidase, partial [Chloroflexi bacterium]|nr:amidase [Chloroflexota bacterium]